jgi:asparagine synthase (glutamine-hydrolysing)
MQSDDGSAALVYNGELYNDAELRAELRDRGVRFRTDADTETVLAALRAWGPAALPRLRGMYALAYADTAAGCVLLARDPLGIKPLYFARAAVGGREEIVFASDLRAILAHPGVRARPDLVTASAYLTTIRLTLGERTLFQGVSTLRPGQTLLIGCDPGPVVRDLARHLPASPDLPSDERERTGLVRETVTDSVRRHLRADVPLCALLSGGLDSSIIAGIARHNVGELRTYCAGAEGAQDEGDFRHARDVAARIGSIHTEVPVTREQFLQRWASMVEDLGLPLGTPNEVAIYGVAAALRAHGHKVALSGEGADELFGGYDLPLSAAAAYEAGPERGRTRPGAFQLASNAWVPLEAKAAVLSGEAHRATEGDAALIDQYSEEFETLRVGAPADSPLQAHLRFQRRVNLAGLLQRLDTATMLAGVEGRTPLADVEVMRLAEALPISDKFRPGTPPETKRILRLAFAPDLPTEVVVRPKASFPLPFQGWLAGAASVLQSSAFAHEVFSEAALAAVAANPAGAWPIAWPVMNLALWGRRWWG